VHKVTRSVEIAMQGKSKSTNLGAVVSVRGSVVDVHFDEHLPPVYSVLRAGPEKKIISRF